MPISSAIFFGVIGLTAALKIFSAPSNSGSELVWPEDPRAHLREALEARNRRVSPPSAWPMTADELCESKADTRDSVGKNTVTILPPLHELCQEMSPEGPLGLKAALGAHALGMITPLGAPFEEFSGGWRSRLTDPELAKAWTELPSAVNFDFRHAFSPRAFAHLRFGLRRDLSSWRRDEAGWNIPLSIRELDLNEPSRGYFHFSGDYIDLTLGRFPIHWSPSPDFGLALSSAVPYHSALSTALKMPRLRYRFLVSSLNPWLEGTPVGGPGENYPVGSEEWRQRNYPVKGQSDNAHNRIYDARIKTLIAHRLESWAGPATFGITEINVVGGKPPDIRDANPFAVFHNDFREGYSNNSVSLDAGLRLPFGLLLAGELFLDDVSYSETEGDLKSPNLMGYLSSLRHAFGMSGWTVVHSLHAIRTDPFLYGAHQPLNVSTSRHVLTSNDQRPGDSLFVDKYVIDYPIGYIRGGDAFDFWYRMEARRGLRWRMRFSAALLARGEIDTHTPYELYYNPHGESPSGRAEREVRLSVEGFWRGSRGLGLNAGLGWQRITDQGHVAGQDVEEIQASAGATWTLLPWAKAARPER